MNKISSVLLGTTVAVALAVAGSSAFAADLPMKAAPVVAAAPAPAGAYITVFGGWAAPMSVGGTYDTNIAGFNAPFGNGYIVGGALGTHLTSNLRGEVEVSYSSRDVSGAITADNGFVSPSTTGSGAVGYLLGNLWYDIDTGSSITPYLGGGIGAAVLMPNVTFVGGPGGTLETDSWAVAGQLGAGIKFQVADNIGLDIGYRAKGVFNANLAGTGTDGDLKGVHLVDQSVQVGLTFGF